jgi:hypothetical protein
MAEDLSIKPKPPNDFREPRKAPFLCQLRQSVEILLDHSLTRLDQVGAIMSLVFQHLNYGTQIISVLSFFMQTSTCLTSDTGFGYPVDQ